MRTGHVVVVGSVNTDFVLRCAALPVAGETIRGNAFRRLPGGKGANQAIAAARMGASVHFVGAVGSDEDGKSAKAALAADGVDLRCLQTIDDIETGLAMVLIDNDTGQNAIALYEGANGRVSAEFIEAARTDIATAAVLVCQLETPLEGVRHAMAVAREAGVPVLLNPAPAMRLDRDILASVDLLIPNESEAMALAGRSTGSVFDEAAITDALHEAGAKAVLITLGEKGAIYSDGGARVRFEARPAVAVDTSGAGDTFIGALAAGMASGSSLEDSIDLAMRAASISVTRQGAMSSIPFLYEIGN